MPVRLQKQAEFQELPVELASSRAAQNLKFERADWTSFRTVEGLMQKAGVAKNKLRRLVLKELTDNALDENAKVRISELSVTTHPVCVARAPAAWATGSARASRMAMRALRPLRRPVSTIEQRAA